MRTDLRHKAVVIPRLNMTNNKNNQYIVVEDAKYKELTFVVGGCKKYENIKHCAVRELMEETRGVLKVNEDNLIYSKPLSFESSYRSPAELKQDQREKVIVVMMYNVYFVDLNINDEQFREMKILFSTRKYQSDQETSGIFMMTKPTLDKERVWHLMRDNILLYLEVNNVRRRNNVRRWTKTILPPRVRYAQSPHMRSAGKW